MLKAFADFLMTVLLNTYFMGVLGCFYLTQFLTMDKFCCKLFQTSDDQGIKPKLRWLLNNCITKLLPFRQTKYCNSTVLEYTLASSVLLDGAML